METVNQATANQSNLSKRISAPGRGKSGKAKCRHCKGWNHTTDECHRLGKSKCPMFENFGHLLQDCWFKDQPHKWKNKSTTHPAKKLWTETVNAVVETVKKPKEAAPKGVLAFAVIEEVEESLAKASLVEQEEGEVTVVWDENENITLSSYNM